MKRSTMWRAVGIALLVAAAAVYVWPPEGEGAAIVGALRRFEAAAGDAKASARECGPVTREWMNGMLEAAKAERRGPLLQRGVLEISVILDLRQARSLEQLREMTVDDALEFYFRIPEAKAPLSVDKIRVDGDQAVARLSKDSTRTPGQKIVLGKGAFFTRADGVWYFEPLVLHQAAMSMVTGKLLPNDKVKIVEESMRKNYPGFDARTWDGPRT
jgi:hypothetical protein